MLSSQAAAGAVAASATGLAAALACAHDGRFVAR